MFPNVIFLRDIGLRVCGKNTEGDFNLKLIHAMLRSRLADVVLLVVGVNAVSLVANEDPLAAQVPSHLYTEMFALHKSAYLAAIDPDVDDSLTK